jgi:hypothetical protein
MLPVIKTFYNQILNDSEGHRYRSWEHCFKAFNNPSSTDDYLNLQLAFYLASWGMYRGSSGLLWKDYTIHSGAIKITNKYNVIRVDENNLFPEISLIQQCFSELQKYYSNINFNNGKEIKYISATDTLITKIMLGIFGATPAIDRYFKDGIKSVIYQSFNINRLSVLYEFAQSNINELQTCQSFIFDKSAMWYPPMKILDMYFWQKGYVINTTPL